MVSLSVIIVIKSIMNGVPAIRQSCVSELKDRTVFVILDGIIEIAGCRINNNNTRKL